MIFKILLLIAIGFVVWALVRGYLRSLDKPPASTRESVVEDMVKCAHCGVNLPRSEAIYSGGELYCTPEHQKLGKK
ncbi:MAG: PP0621 family protein [Hylemonella sp.]|nr:PP0621 family protein [Hylemonella sp.]